MMAGREARRGKMKHEMSRNEKCVYVPQKQRESRHKLKERAKINFEISFSPLIHRSSSSSRVSHGRAKKRGERQN
jgi:hypothetical protein